MDKTQIEAWEYSRTLLSIWSEDITRDEVYLAEKAFKEGSLEDSRRWGNHLLKILKNKAGMVY